MATPALATRQPQQTEIVVLIHASGKLHVNSVFIMRTVKTVANNTLETPGPHFACGLLVQAEGLGPDKKIVKQPFPIFQNNATPGLTVSGVEPLFIQAASTTVVPAIPGWQSANITHSASRLRPWRPLSFHNLSSHV
jgi:hypothetical protein